MYVVVASLHKGCLVGLLLFLKAVLVAGDVGQPLVDAHGDVVGDRRRVVGQFTDILDAAVGLGVGFEASTFKVEGDINTSYIFIEENLV